MFRLSFQSAPELPAHDPLPISKHLKHVFQTCGNFSTFSDPDLWAYQLKIGIPLTHAPGNIETNFDFMHLLFLSNEPVQDRWNDRQQDV